MDFSCLVFVLHSLSFTLIFFTLHQYEYNTVLVSWNCANFKEGQKKVSCFILNSLLWSNISIRQFWCVGMCQFQGQFAERKVWRHFYKMTAHQMLRTDLVLQKSETDHILELCTENIESKNLQ